jgi:DNA helicase HerA-like ATPase
MVTTLTKWETSIAPAIAIEPTEFNAIAVYWGMQILAIPDLISIEQARTGMSYETALQSLLQAQQQWIRQLHGNSQFTLSLRIITTGDPHQDLCFGLVGKTEAATEIDAIATARNFYNQVRDSFPNGYTFQPCKTPEELALLRLPFLPSAAGQLGEFRRTVTSLQTITSKDLQGVTGKQITPWTAQADLFQSLFRALIHHPNPAAIAINLKPTQLTPQESALIGNLADRYAKLTGISHSETEQNPIFSQGLNYQEKFLEAEQAAQTWTFLQSSWRSPFELSVNLISESSLPQSVTSALQTAVSGTPNREPASHGTGEVFLAQSEAQKMAVRQNWTDLTLHRWANTFDLDRLPWLFSPEEVHSIFRLPIADRQGVWGLPSAVGAGDARRPISESQIAIADIHIGGLTLSQKQLTQHLLICGVPGSGKTNTSLYLLETLWREHRIPWMVLEPAKTEYRGLQSVNSLKNDLLIFSLGDERVSPFRFNPFELPPTINLDSHLGALVDLFSVSMSMWGPLPNVVEQLIQEAYKRKGYTILGDNTNLLPPRFSDLVALIPEIVPKLGYKKESTDEITAALSVRLNKFCRGALGQMLNTTQSIPFDRLMQSPIILEMSQMTNSDDRAFVMGLILNRCYQYWTARRHEATGELKHLLLVEEAHNLLANVSESANQEQANPKGKAVKNFANMLAEVRGFGQGIAIAEQNPDGLVADVMVNTNIKLAHRVVEAKNRSALGRSMLLTPQQETGLAALKTGQMLYYIGGQSEPSLTTAPNFKDADNGFNPRLTDAAIHTRFQQQIQAQYSSLYAPLTGCPTGDRLTACIEQGADLVQILLEHPRYKEMKQTLLLELLAAPFGAPSGDRVRSILGKILLERGVKHLALEQIQGVLNSALSLLALEAVQEKGKVHGWLGEQVQQAHSLLVRSLLDTSTSVQSEWIELCRIPEQLLQLGIPHPKYAECEAPGVFRYENHLLLIRKDDFLSILGNASDHPKIILKNWCTQHLHSLIQHLTPELTESIIICAAIQLTENMPHLLTEFLEP